MPSFSKELEEHALALAWSLWAELGVSGWERRHTHVAVDPEPLVVFTAALGDADPRLRDEVTDWCIAHGRWVSGARLRNLVRGHPATEAYGELAATVNAHGLGWPGATAPRVFRQTGRSELPSFARPALLSLRLRALVGVTARAEILRLLLADSTAAFSASELAPEAAYTKRNIADALEGLRMAGILEAEPVRNQILYRLARQDDLGKLIGDLPASFPTWRPLFLILLRSLRVARETEGLTPLAAAAEAGAALQDLLPDLRAARVPGVPIGTTGEVLLTSFERWALGLARRLADGAPEFSAPSRVGRTLG